MAELTLAQKLIEAQLLNNNDYETDSDSDSDDDLVCEMCNTAHPSVGIATGENGQECLVCKYCDVDGSNYNGWGDEEEEEED